MSARIGELGSLAFAIAFLAILGFGIILRGLDRARYVARKHRARTPRCRCRS